MRELHAHLRPQVSYVAGDACDLKPRAGTAASAAAADDANDADTEEKKQEEQDRLNYAADDQSFDAVLDKGTLDAIVCGCGADHKSRALVAEAARVLKHGGAFVLITYGAPARRLGYLLPDDYTQSSSDEDEEEEEEGEKEGKEKEEEEEETEEAEAAAPPRPASPPPPRPYGGRQLPWGPRDVDIYLIVKPDAREEAEAAVGAPPLAAEEEEPEGGGGGSGGDAKEEDDEEEPQRDVVIFGPLCPKDDLLMERVSSLQGAHFAYVCRRPLDR
jgi:SAM-dependent methyltransferase